MTIVRPTFFGCRLLFTTRNFVFGMNNIVAEYQISSSVTVALRTKNLRLNSSLKFIVGKMFIESS